MIEIDLEFKGPFKLSEIETLDLKGRRDIEGVYLWTVKQEKTDDYMIHYIGESIKVITRQSEHLTQVLGLNYGIFYAESLKKGELNRKWLGMWRDKSISRIKSCLSHYEQTTSDVINYLNTIEIFIAETELESNLRRHCEAVIGNNLRIHHKDSSVIYPSDNRIILRKKMEAVILKIRSTRNILGLDSEIEFHST